MVAYGEILLASDWAMPSTLATTLRQIQHPRCLITILRSKDDVRGALQAFLGAEVGTGLFFGGKRHVAIQIIASYFEDRLITTNPQELLEKKGESPQQ